MWFDVFQLKRYTQKIKPPYKKGEKNYYLSKKKPIANLR